MARIVNIHEAKTHFSRLVDQAAGGEEVVIAKAGRPVARLLPLERASEPRQLGGWKGRVRIAADFDVIDEEIAKLFEGA